MRVDGSRIRKEKVTRSKIFGLWRPHCVVEISKRIFIFTVRATDSKTLIRHENGAELFVYVLTDNILTKENFENGDVTIIVIPLPEFSSNTSPESSAILLRFSNSSGVVWKENVCCVFKVKPLFFNSPGVVLLKGAVIVLLWRG